MKFLLFSDWHYDPGVFYERSVEDLRMLEARALEAGCDFIIHAGDFCTGGDSVEEHIKIYNGFSLPSYHCLGNHDSDRTTYEKTVARYGMPNGYYFFDAKGYRIVVLDPNYLYLDGNYIPYSKSNYYAHPEARDYIPPEQLAWLRETLDTSPFPCILISHESIEPGPGNVRNKNEVQQIIDDANQRRAHTVLMCINGHNHCDHLRLLNGVLYFEVNSATFYALAFSHGRYPQKLADRFEWVNSTLVYEEPLYAIVTVEGTRVRIEGKETRMLHGVTLDSVTDKIYTSRGRTCEPIIRSADVTLH
jgi:hypothetical protein